MCNQSLPPAVRQFLSEWVHSIEQLEILCLLSDSAERSWSTKDVLSRIQSSEISVAENMAKFAREGLLELQSDGRYRFAPTRRELALILAQLAKIYRERRVSVVNAIYSRERAIGSRPGSSENLTQSKPFRQPSRTEPGPDEG